MKSKNFVLTAFLLGFTLATSGLSFGQAPPTTLRLTSKVRDFKELPNASLPSTVPYHPDFNTFEGCLGTGYVAATIQTTGATDTANFPNDNRNPRLINPRSGCFTNIARFDEWYNDRSADINRPFLYDLIFQRTTGGMYEYNNSSFFPMDDDSLSRTDPATGEKVTRNLKGAALTSFGHLNTKDTALAKHNFGFTMEFHANFTYLAASVTGKAQTFAFTGDDDVWVFIKDQLVIDIGGLHSAESRTVTLDAAMEASLGLVHNQSYILDFFIAERHITQSNCRITTSLVLETEKVATPVASLSGRSFPSQVAINLTSATAGATIYYTLNGNGAPDSNSTLYDPTKPILITSNTILQAIAYKLDWQKSEVMNETYTKDFTPSTLDILDQNGNPLSGGYITELNSSYTIKVTTTQAGLNTLSTNATTKVNADAETVVLGTRVAQGNNFIFTGTSPFLIKMPAAAANATTEAATYDSLIVRWENKEVLKDIAEKRILVRPAPKQARTYFSTKPDGSDTTDQYLGTETVIYLVVIDQVLPSGVAPTITLETTPKNGAGRVKDVLTVSLLPSGTPGKLIATIPVDINLVTATGDAKLQLWIEDQITATYTDPADKDIAVANAGYGIAPEIEAALQFTDKTFNVLPNGVYFSPTEGSLYLSYRDDWVNSPTFDKKTVTLTIVNGATGTAPGDTETFAIDIKLAKRVGSAGVWEGSISLKDGPVIKPRNDSANTYILGKVHAVVTSHNKGGGNLLQVTDDLLVAYGNKDAVIEIEGGKGPTIQPTREDTVIKITVKDQSISSTIDTLYVTTSCTESKDQVLNVMLIETAPTSGIYVTKFLSKSEGAKVDGDGVLQCGSRDFLKVSYKDPVYGDPKEIEVLIDKPVTPKIYFSSKADGSDEITSINDTDADIFYAVIHARSPNVAKVDKIGFTFTTTQGETETFEAVETSPYSEVFIVKIPFAFVNGAIGPPNSILEGKITEKEVNNNVTAIGSLTIEGTPVKQSINLVAGYAPVKKAYIKDTNGDGAADKVYIEFEKRLGRLPATVGAQWNSSTSDPKAATGAKVSFLNADSNIVVLDFTGSPFVAGLTAVGSTNPLANLPNDELFKGQKPVIQDSVGPVIQSAKKRPAKSNLQVSNDPSYNLDTLIIVLSEPLKDADFRQMIRVASSCDEYGVAKVIEAVKASTTNPNEYIVIVDNTQAFSPTVGQCVFLNADAGKYTDVAGNPPPQHGVPLTGDDRDRNIQLFRGFPPVAGLDPNNATFQVAVQDSRDPDKQGYATNPSGGAGSWQVAWIPPVGFDNPAALANPEYKFDPYGATLADLPNGSREPTTPVFIPRSISAIQVVSTSSYIAHLSIFDIYGNFVASSKQVFGGRGELQNPARQVKGGYQSFLVWDMRDKKGQLAGQGVYVWKVRFEFKGGKQEIQYTKTGILRQRK
ncbi:MAG: fibro-slime domain-containing protein [Fibrobacterota bacterium]|nr:fibro-slime domain-containing protein [Fibrobacterota bacterium]